MLKVSRKKTLIKIVLYLVILNLISWAGLFLAVSDGSAETRDLALLIWLIAPLLTSLAIRLFSRDWSGLGLRPGFRNNGRWYFFSIIVFPAIIAITLLAGILFRAVSLDGFSGSLFLGSVAASLVFTFVKNVSEEFSWRGFMTVKMNDTVKFPIAGHLLTGFFWGLWHIPYYLVLLDRVTLDAYTSLGMGIFLPFTILGITVCGLLFGALRMKTGSVWPGVIMHTLSNCLTVTLLTGGHLKVAPRTELIFTPGWHGIISIILFALAGFWLMRKKPLQG